MTTRRNTTTSRQTESTKISSSFSWPRRILINFCLPCLSRNEINVFGASMLAFERGAVASIYQGREAIKKCLWAHKCALKTRNIHMAQREMPKALKSCQTASSFSTIHLRKANSCDFSLGMSQAFYSSHHRQWLIFGSLNSPWDLIEHKQWRKELMHRHSASPWWISN